MATVRIPMQLESLENGSSNAFFDNKAGTNLDYGRVTYIDAATGTTYWAGIIPLNVNATPAWDLVVYHDADASGNVILDVSARTIGDNEVIDSTFTSLEANKSLATGTAGTMQIDNLAASNYDGTLTVAGGDLLIVKIDRDGANASDTVGDLWHLLKVCFEVDI